MRFTSPAKTEYSSKSRSFFGGSVEGEKNRMCVGGNMVGGLGPRGLDSCDPFMKGIVTWGYPYRITNHRAPKHQITH